MPVLGYLDKRSMCNFYQLVFFFFLFFFGPLSVTEMKKYISVYEIKRKSRI